MENLFFSLNVIFFAIYIFNFTTWVTEEIFPIFCVVIFFLALLPFIWRKPPRTPLDRPRNIQKRSRKPCHQQKRNPQEILKACRVCIGELHKMRKLLMILKRYIKNQSKNEKLPDHDSEEYSSTVSSLPSSSPSPSTFLQLVTSTFCASSTFSSISDSFPQSNSGSSVDQQRFSTPPSPPSPPPSTPTFELLEPNPYLTASESSLVCRDCNTWQLGTIDRGFSPVSRVSLPSSFKILSGVGQANSAMSPACFDQRSNKTLILQAPPSSLMREKQRASLSADFMWCREALNHNYQNMH